MNEFSVTLQRSTAECGASVARTAGVPGDPALEAVVHPGRPGAELAVLPLKLLELFGDPSQSLGVGR